MTNGIIVTEINASGEGRYMVAMIDDVQYREKYEGEVNWETRELTFEKLLEQIPEQYKPFVEAEYDYFCDGLKGAEAEAEILANMSDEERIAMFEAALQSMGEYEEVYEEIEE